VFLYVYEVSHLEGLKRHNDGQIDVVL